MSSQDHASIKNLEMGYTITEFAKTLHGQFLSEQHTYSCRDVNSTHWEIVDTGEALKVSIKISQAPPRIVAMLSLPVLDVLLEFEGASKEQQEQFLKRFFTYFHKGGG